MEAESTEILHRAVMELTAEVRLLREARTVAAGSIPVDSGPSLECVGVESLITPPLPQGLTRYSEEEVTLAELRLNIAKSQEELDQIVRELARSDEEQRNTERSLNLLQEQVQDLETRRCDLESKLAGMEASRRECEALRQEAANLTHQLQQMRGEADLLEIRRRDLELREGEAQRGREEGRHANQLLGRIWPGWLMSPGLLRWKERLESDVFNSEAPPSFGLLFAAIHTYNAALRDPDTRFLLDALRELGRRLYQWLKDLNLDEMAAAEQVEVWAAAINTECEGRSSLLVAYPGTQANNKSMVFTPKGGSSPDVVSVRSWCVFDQQGRPIHRAEVVV
jgi:hypothetical protein